MPHSGSASIEAFDRGRELAKPHLEDLFTARVSELCHPGHVVFWEGDCISDVFRIGDGVLRLYRILPDGRRAITGFAFAGDLLGLGFHDRCLYTAEAVTKVRLRRFPHLRLQTLAAENSQLHREMINVIAVALEAAQEQMVLLGQKSAEERVASFLLTNGLRIAKGQRDRIVYDLPMTRLDMADYLGLTIETVCRAVTKLKNAGLVCFEGRHRVVLQQPRELAIFAGHDEYGNPETIMFPLPAPWPQPLSISLDRDRTTRTKVRPPLRH